MSADVSLAVTLGEYVRAEDAAAERHSFHQGEVYAMVDTLGVRVRVDEVYAKVEAFGGPGRESRPAGPPRS